MPWATDYPVLQLPEARHLSRVLNTADWGTRGIVTLGDVAKDSPSRQDPHFLVLPIKKWPTTKYSEVQGMPKEVLREQPYHLNQGSSQPI